MFFIIPLLFFGLFKKFEKRQFVIQGFAQGTDYTIKYLATDSIVTKANIDGILAQVDSSMSLYKPYSQINNFNASKKGQVLDAHFLKVMRKSFEIYKATSGLFDVTVKPLVQAWGFGVQATHSFPDSLEIKQILSCVGMGYLKLQSNFLVKHKPCVQIDLNGIAQGYSVDLVAEYLLKKGVADFVVEIGGELRVNGYKADGSRFRIGIEGPADSSHAEPSIKHTISLTKGAITTSGNFRKFLHQGSKTISHLINPKTGFPLQNEMISVTVYAPDALTADGYDNAIMAMNLQEALSFVERQKDMEAYIIYRNKNGQVADTLTKGFKKLIVD